MFSGDPIDEKFDQADINHDGGIDQREFRQFVDNGGPPSSYLENDSTFAADYKAASSRTGTGFEEIISYPIGIDIAIAGFTANPASYERFAGSISAIERHGYGVGPDVAVGAPNVAREVNQYDPAGAMFNYADVNHDGKIDRIEFCTFMHSV